MLLLQLSFRLEPVIDILPVCSTALDVYFVSPALNLLVTWGVCGLQPSLLGWCAFVFLVLSLIGLPLRFHVRYSSYRFTAGNMLPATGGIQDKRLARGKGYRNLCNN